MDLKGRGPFILKVQSCDSMGQVKAKALDVVFKSVPYSHRPGIGTFELGKLMKIVIGSGNLQRDYGREMILALLN